MKSFCVLTSIVTSMFHLHLLAIKCISEFPHIFSQESHLLKVITLKLSPNLMAELALSSASVVLCLSELGETLCAILQSKFLQLSWVHHLDGRLNLFAGKCGLLVVDEQVASLFHQHFKQVDHDLVQLLHCLLGDAQLWLHVLYNSEDVGLERVVIAET